MPVYKAQPTITLVRDEGGDWIGLYIDGKLAMENHSLNENDMLRALGIGYQSYEIDMSAGDPLPQKLNELDLTNALEHGEWV